VAVALLVPPSALLVPPSALLAYEPDHYGWTYYLALQVGFTERQAYQLASGAYALDWDPDTEPMGSTWDKVQVLGGYPPELVQAKWLRFHAFTETAYLELGQDLIEAEKQRHQDRLWGLALREGNPGPYLHFVQDRFAHYGWENVRGHALAGHLPDTLADDPDRARQMTEATLQALLRFKGLLCSRSPLGPPCTTSRAPDPGRIDEVLARLFAANPVPPGVPRSEEIRLRLPHELDATREGLTTATRTAIDMLTGGTFWSAIRAGGQSFLDYLDSVRSRYYPDVPMSALLKTPDLDASVSVIRRAVSEDREAGRIPAFGAVEGFGGRAEAWFDNDLPPRWMEYDHDGDGSVRAPWPPYAVEMAVFRAGDPELEYEPVEGSPNRAYRIHLRIPYSFEGLAEGLPFLHPVPTLVLHELSDFGAGERLRRDHENGSFEVTKTIQRSRADLESGELTWKVTIQAYGFEPVVHELVLALPVEIERMDSDELRERTTVLLDDLLDELRTVAATAAAASERSRQACDAALDAVSRAASARAALAGRLDAWPQPADVATLAAELDALVARAREVAARGVAAVEALGPLRGEAGTLRDAVCSPESTSSGDLSRARDADAAARATGLERVATARFVEAESALAELRSIADRIAVLAAPAESSGSRVDDVLSTLDELERGLERAASLIEQATAERERLAVLDARGSDLVQRILGALEVAGGGSFAAAAHEVDELFGRLRAAVDAAATCDPSAVGSAAAAERAEIAGLRARAEELKNREQGALVPVQAGAASDTVAGLLADLEAAVAAGELFRDSILERAAQARSCADRGPPASVDGAPASGGSSSVAERTPADPSPSPGWTLGERVRTTGGTPQPPPRAAAPSPSGPAPTPIDPAAQVVAAAEAAFARCDYVSALALAERLAAMSPEHPWLAANFGTVERLAAQQRATANHLQIAQSLLASGRLDRARSALTDAARQAPGCMSDPIASLVGEVTSAAAERRQANREALSQGLGSLLGAIGQVAGRIAANGGASGILPPGAAPPTAGAAGGHAHGPDGRDLPGGASAVSPTCALLDWSAYPAGWVQQFERDPSVRWYIQTSTASGVTMHSIAPAQPDSLSRLSQASGASYLGPYPTAAAAYQAARARCSNVVQPQR
jgi:hypothetical protein